jgi:hypothetical protein
MEDWGVSITDRLRLFDSAAFPPVQGNRIEAAIGVASKLKGKEHEQRHND